MTIHEENPDRTLTYNIIHRSPLKIKPKVIIRSLFLENFEKYRLLDATQSYRKLNDLRIFKYVDINFRESNLPASINPKLNYLDCAVRLTRNPVHSYSIEAQGTNSGGDLGISGYLVYSNKNLFRGGEVFNIRLKGGLEAQKQAVTNEIEKDRFLFFNTFEAGIEATLYIPKFLAPINEDLFSKYFRPKTSISLGYNIQNRIEYDRIITNATFGYEWSETSNKQHILYPVDINVVSVNTTPAFDEVLAGESQRFQNQYTNHLIMGLRYSYIFSNQELNKIKNFFYFRGNLESSGNLLDLLVQSTNLGSSEEGFRTVFGIRYSQYVKANTDLRYYFRFDKKKTLAMRTFLGIAVPYSNSIDIPFEKGYFGGGANGLRAWPLRFLGPGGFKNTEDKTIERVGDIMLEANIEYRFPVYRVFTAALFYDIGNIWLLNDNESFPGGKFNINDIAGELAMDFGLGIRLDFNYFIFRIDFAQRLKDPAKPVGDRWVVGNYAGWFNPVLNLGIGYPF
jgi:outer membrane protein assembly factor BamA